MSELGRADDVFRVLVEESDESWLMGLVAFAIFEQRRIEWKNHLQGLNGKDPSSDDVERWYLEQPESALLRAKADAENLLNIYTEEVGEQLLLDERRQIERDIIVSELRLARRFWPQFGINVAAGTVSAFLFAMILLAFALLISADMSPIKMLKDATVVESSQVESKNGNTPTK